MDALADYYSRCNSNVHRGRIRWRAGHGGV